MARKPRIEYPGAVYHVMSRGNRQGAIFLDDKDCETFINTLSEACTKTGWLVHAFVLMGNHYHLLLETPEANLVAGMKWLQGTYTQRFNARHKVSGHLLQGRYKALVVDSSSGDYFVTVSSYIHLNPARTKGFGLEPGRLVDYRWSSFPLYSRPAQRPEWLAVGRVLGALGFSDDQSGRTRYRQYIQMRASETSESAERQWVKIRRGWYLGSESFRDELLERLDSTLKGKQRNSFGGEEVRKHDEAEAERILCAGLHCLGLERSSFADLPKGAAEKAVLAWYLRKHTVAGRSWIAKRLCMGDESRVTKLVSDVDQDARYDKLKEKLRQIPEFTD